MFVNLQTGEPYSINTDQHIQGRCTNETSSGVYVWSEWNWEQCLISVRKTSGSRLLDLSASHSSVSPEVQPRFVKGTKRYGRRSTPEFTHSISDLTHTPSETKADVATRTGNGTLPVKREVRHTLHNLTHTHYLSTSTHTHYTSTLLIHTLPNHTLCLFCFCIKNSLALEDSSQPLNARNWMISM